MTDYSMPSNKKTALYQKYMTVIYVMDVFIFPYDTTLWIKMQSSLHRKSKTVSTFQPRPSYLLFCNHQVVVSAFQLPLTQLNE